MNGFGKEEYRRWKVRAAWSCRCWWCTGEMCRYLCWKRGKIWGFEISHGKETGEGRKCRYKKRMRGQGRRREGRGREEMEEDVVKMKESKL